MVFWALVKVSVWTVYCMLFGLMRIFARYVIAPYNDYPQLLGLLLKLLNGDLAWSTRREVLKVCLWFRILRLLGYWYWLLVHWHLSQVLGIMGALDPYVHKRNQPNLPGSHGEVTHTNTETGQHIRSMDDLPMDLGPSFTTSSEDYYSTVQVSAINTS